LRTNFSFINKDTAICAVPLADIYDLAQKANEYLFATNIRNYLQKSKINKGMAKTLNSEPANFWYYNNGITIVCDDFKAQNSKIVMTTPQVVNGCQTVTTIRNFGSQHGKKSFENAEILARIVRAPDPEVKNSITTFTNAQNAVRGKDLYSLSSFQKRLVREMQRRGYFYEIQSGKAAIMAPHQLKKFAGDPSLQYLEPATWNHVIAASDAVQAYAATFGMMPQIAHSSPQSVTPLGNQYEFLFPEELQPDADRFLLPFLVVQYARRTLGYGRGGSGWRKVGHFLFAFATYIMIGLYLGRFKLEELEEGKQTPLPPADMRQVLGSQSLAQAVLRLADAALELFFDDGLVMLIIREQHGGDLKNFMKLKPQGSKWFPVLLTRISKAIERSRKELATD